MQGENPVSLAIGTQVSAKYKGAFCEAKVRSVIKEVKCRITFKGGLGSCTLSDDAIQPIDDQPIVQGANVKAKHPDKQEYFDAVINQIKDQSKYTVTFNDGDIAQLRRNALRLKSGKHFNPSESLDNLPLTHPEHFSTPVGGTKHSGGGSGRRRNRSGAVSERSGQGGSKERNKDGGDTTDMEKDNDLDSEGESENEDTEGNRRGGSGPISSAYMPNIGRVVWAENTDKKSKGKETNWFPALVVAPTACDIPTDTKEDFLIRSFKDGRYYTVAKKDTNKFDKDNTSKFTKDGNIRDALQKAISYIEKDELPPHWDKEIIFAMDEPSTSTESSESASERSEDGEDDDDSEEDEQTPEEKDHLVAELYKHMEDKGSPINHTPAINGKDIDLYGLYRIVDRLGGHTRVTNKSLWKQVGRKLGFENAWSINQVRVHYNRYLKSFEELNRTLGCTMVMASMSRGRHQSGNVNRVQVRGKHRHLASHQQKSPVHKELQSSPIACTQTSSLSSSLLSSSNVQQTSLPKSTPSSRTASPSSANTLSSFNKAESVADAKSNSSINNQVKNDIPAPSMPSSKPLSSESSVVETSKDAPPHKPLKDKSLKSDNSNKNEPAVEKESASKVKTGNKISKAFHNVMKSIKKSPRTATMEEKEISLPSKFGADDVENINEKSTTIPNLKKDNLAVTPSSATKQPTQTEQKNEMKMSRRKRTNSSTSSLAAAMQVKAQKDDIGNHSMRQEYLSASSPSTKKVVSRTPADAGSAKPEKDSDADSKKSNNKQANNKISGIVAIEASNGSDSGDTTEIKVDKQRTSEKDGISKINNRKVGPKVGGHPSPGGAGGKKKTEATNIFNKKEREADDRKIIHNDDNEKQHLSSNDVVEAGDRIKVFYIRETIYPAKVIQVQEPKNGEKWPRYRVHYDGWNKRYDEWIKRSRIAEFNSEKEKITTGGPPGSTTEDSEPTSPPTSRKEVTRKDSGMSTTSSSSASSRLENISPFASKKKLKNNDKESDNLVKEKSVGRISKIPKLASSNERESASRAGTPCSLRGSRTNSPVATLKRQNSRGSLKKDTDESEAEADRDVDEVLSSDSAGGRKSSRLQKGIPVHSGVSSGDDRARRSDRRSDRKRVARDESETDDTDNLKDDDEKDVISKECGPSTKPKRGRKGFSTKTVQDDSESEDNKPSSDNLKKMHSRSAEKNTNRATNIKTAQTSTRTSRTPLKGSSSDQEEDPYDFKEPEPFDVCDVKFETPRKQTSPLPSCSMVSSSKKIKEDDVKKDSLEGMQSEPMYSSAADSSSSGSSSKKAHTSNLSSIASSTSSASDEGNFSDEEKPDIENISTDKKHIELHEEDPLGGLVGRSKKNNKAEKDHDKKGADEKSKEDDKNLDMEEDIIEEDLGASLNQQTIGASEVGKPLLPLPKKLQEVFPHLAAIRTTALPGNTPRGIITSNTGNNSPGQSNSSTNNANLPKSSSSHVPSQSTSTMSTQKTNIANHQQSQLAAGRTICTPPITKQKLPLEISETPSNKPPSGTNKVDLNNKDTCKLIPRRSRSRSPISLDIVAEDIVASQSKPNDSVPMKKQRRKPTKPTSSELVGSESESENDNEEDVEADGDVDSNGEDSVYPKSRIRQQQQHHRKRSSSRAESKKDNRSAVIPSSTNFSTSSNESSPSKISNKHSPNMKNKNKTLTTSLTVKPLISIAGIPSASAIKRKRDLDAASETTESDEETITQSRAPSSQHSTKRNLTSSHEKTKRHKKDVTGASYGGGDQDDLDLACGETIPGSPVHPGQSDLQHSTPDQFSRENTTPRVSVSAVNSIVGINTPQPHTASVGVKSVAQTISAPSTLRSQHAPSTHPTANNSNQNSNRLEMPFASVPESVHGSSSRAEIQTSVSPVSGSTLQISNIKTNQTSNGHTKVPMSNSNAVKGKHYQSRGDGDIESPLGYSSTSQSPTHGDDSAGNSRSKSPQGQGDLQGDSSEVDMDSLSGRGAGSGADSSTWPGEVGGKGTIKRKTGDRLAAAGNLLSMRERGSRSPAAGSRSPLTTSGQTGKRKKRSRKTSMSGQAGLRGRRRHGSGRNGNGMTPNREDDSDEDEEGNIEIRHPSDSRQSTRVSSLGSLDNDALAALSQRSPRTSKFNYYVKFDSMMDSSERISKLQDNLEELRKTYMTLRSKLTAIERRRKKIRRRERERTENPSGPEVEATA